MSLGRIILLIEGAIVRVLFGPPDLILNQVKFPLIKILQSSFLDKFCMLIYVTV